MTDEDGAVFAAEDLRRLRHDIRSPLMVISGFARMLSGERELTDEERREFSLRIEQAAEALRQTLDEALGG